MVLEILRKASVIHAVKCTKASDMNIATESFEKLQEIKLKLESTTEDEIEKIKEEIEHWKNSNPIVRDGDIDDLIKRK